MHCFFCFHLRDLSSWFGVVRNIRFLFRSNPGCGWWCSWGSAQNSLCELQLPMPKTPWFLEARNESYACKSGFCDTSEGFLWAAGSEISSQLTAKMIQTTKMLHNGTSDSCRSVSHSLRRWVKHWTGRPLRVGLMQRSELQWAKRWRWSGVQCHCCEELLKRSFCLFIAGWGPTLATWRSYSICPPVAFPSLCFAPSPNP